MKAWREIAEPHQDVLVGKMKQADFAADISSVASGNAPQEYQDAKEFFSRTFITEGMRHLLISVARRLSEKGGDPVIQLQTNFGGGKTHTLLAVYHLATRNVPTSELEGITEILGDAQVQTLPKAKTAVIDGTNLSVNQPRRVGNLELRTLWGELAYALLGEEGYEIVADSDRSGTAPGKAVLDSLLRKAAPCVILLDELVAFFRQLDQDGLTAGTYNSNMSFIQALTESVKKVPNAVLLASLPESESEVGDSFAKTVLEGLEKCFGRVQNLWKPVDTDESFEIVRRRLFKSAGDQNEIDAVCREFADYYRTHKDEFPSEVLESRYLDRLRSAYPIHPELFDRLYFDWSTLDRFQRTRGILQYMAVIIRKIWNSENSDPMIMPGSIPLGDSEVRTMSTRYLPQGWDPVIEKEIDGNNAAPKQEFDAREPRFGACSAAVRTARTLFLGTAPSSPEQTNRGIDLKRVLLGAAQPGNEIAAYRDVLRRLRDKLHYLYSDRDYYWFDTRPNLQVEMESRKKKFSGDSVRCEQTIKKYLEKLLGPRNDFAGVHLFVSSDDIPDDIGDGVRLVFLPPNRKIAYSAENSKEAYKWGIDIVKNHGTSARVYQNRLIFVYPDQNRVDNLIDQCAVFMAWSEILDDGESGRLNMDTYRKKETTEQKNTAEAILKQTILAAYRWILVPKSANDRKIEFDALQFSGTEREVLPAIFNSLKSNEFVIGQWSEILLKRHLTANYFTNGTAEISLKQVWEDSCKYLGFPRLLEEGVFKVTVNCGLSKSLFGYAKIKDGERYAGFCFGKQPILTLFDSGVLLIQEDAAREYQARLDESAASAPVSAPANADTAVPGNITGGTNTAASDAGSGSAVPGNGTGESHNQYKRFWASIELPENATAVEYSGIDDALRDALRLSDGAKIKVTVEYEADVPNSFSQETIRTLKENCNTLNQNYNIRIEPHFEID